MDFRYEFITPHLEQLSSLLLFAHWLAARQSFFHVRTELAELDCSTVVLVDRLQHVLDKLISWVLPSCLQNFLELSGGDVAVAILVELIKCSL